MKDWRIWSMAWVCSEWGKEERKEKGFSGILWGGFGNFEEEMRRAISPNF